VRAPTLLIVADTDSTTALFNRQAMLLLSCVRQLVVVPGADAPAKERRKLQPLAELTRRWFEEHLSSRKSDVLPPPAPKKRRS
jgi:hypothetical protein